MQTNSKCPYCKSEAIVKRGLSPTRNRGKQQRYKCNNCKKTFIQDLGFWKMKTKPSIITTSIDMYLSNLSSRKMRNQLTRHMNTKRSHVTILNWVYKYVLKVHKFVDKQKFDLGGIFYADETVIKRNGHDDKFWACVDWQTRLITGIHYSTSANPKEAVRFLRKAIEKGKPSYIQTDAAMFYPKAFRKLFYSRQRKDLEIGHRIQNYAETGIHNYKIETVFMKIKDRVIDFRGLKALWSAPILLAGIVIQHNFIEEHTTTRQVPCELAGLRMRLGADRWMGLIKLSS